MGTDEAFSDLSDTLMKDLPMQAMLLAERVSMRLARLKQLEDPIRCRIESDGLVARRTNLATGVAGRDSDVDLLIVKAEPFKNCAKTSTASGKQPAGNLISVSSEQTAHRRSFPCQGYPLS